MELFTIGYEGLDQKQFLSWLRNHNISVVADVRYFPLSRKKGFSKSGLSTLLGEYRIDYMNFRDLGAPKELRTFLAETKDYSTFFRRYKKVISKNTADIDGILSMVNNGEKVALLCYEKDPETCHRKIVANEVMKKDGNGLKIKHLGFY
ncbi:MAG: DUF488 domain-containing protein [Deltaproteobacteria bacterium]|nr:DUF488 domain-containing protein [Deltaproteobacteria bacterium]